MPTEFGFLPIVGVFVLTLLIGRALYKRNANKSNAATAVGGIFGSSVRILAGFFTMLGGTPIFLGFGFILVLWGVLGVSSHKDRLDETTSGSTLRSKLY